jgi:uncharacterized protein (TIGR02246 family)
MKRCIGALVLAALVAVASTAAADEHTAGDANALKDASDGLHAAWMAGDAEAMISYFHPDNVGFGMDGGVLASLDEEFLHQAFETGYSARLQQGAPTVQVFGDIAIVSVYETGRVEVPGGGVQEGTWRLTASWVNTEAGWKCVNFHFSPLQAGTMHHGQDGPPPEHMMGMPELMEHAHDQMERMHEQMENMRERMGRLHQGREEMHHGMEEMRGHIERLYQGREGMHDRDRRDMHDRDRRDMHDRGRGEMHDRGREKMHDRPHRGREHDRREAGMEHREHGGPHLFVQHQVADFEQWVEAFKENAAARAESGSEGGIVFRAIDEPNTVFVGLRWSSVEGMMGFVGSPHLKEAMENAGVIGEPMMFFAEDGELVADTEGFELKEHEGPWVIIHHKVEGFDHWKDAFDEHSGARREHGSLGGMLFRNAHDGNDLLLILALEDLELFQQLFASEDMQHAMREAGVVGEPDVRFVKPAFQTDN